MFCQISTQIPTQRKGKKEGGSREEREKGGREKKYERKKEEIKRKGEGEENKEKERIALNLTKLLDVLTNLQEVQKINLQVNIAEMKAKSKCKKFYKIVSNLFSSTVN